MKAESVRRLEVIREDIKKIRGVSTLSRRLGVSRLWIYRVLDGEGTSERVLRAAEELIAERKRTETIN